MTKNHLLKTGSKHYFNLNYTGVFDASSFVCSYCDEDIKTQTAYDRHFTKCQYLHQQKTREEKEKRKHERKQLVDKLKSVL